MFIKKLIRRIVLNCLAFPIWLYYWVIYVLIESRNRTPLDVCRGALQPTGLWCIFAIYQGRILSPNLITMVTCLRDKGYNVILAHNGPCDGDLVGTFGPLCHTVMIRRKGGRDLGSYKEATAYLAEIIAGEEIKQVIYCNDSVFIRPSTFATLLERLKNMPDDYIGIIESYERRYHVQSWFFAFSGRLFRESFYQAFWQNYIPTSHRERSTVKGELALSQYLMRHGIYPKSIYSNKTVIEHIFAIEKSKIIPMLIVFSTNSKIATLYPRLAKILDEKRGSADEYTLLLLERAISDMSELCNPMILFNLLLLQCSDFPFLKKELVYKDVYFCVQIEYAVELWKGNDAEQLHEIKTFFRSRDALSWQPIKRLLTALGVG